MKRWFGNYSMILSILLWTAMIVVGIFRGRTDIGAALVVMLAIAGGVLMLISIAIQRVVDDVEQDIPKLSEQLLPRKHGLLDSVTHDLVDPNTRTVPASEVELPQEVKESLWEKLGEINRAQREAEHASRKYLID